MKPELTRRYIDVLKDLGLTDNTDSSSVEECFVKHYEKYIELHKESNYKYINNQKEFDGLVLSSVLSKKSYSICDYCHSVEPIHLPMMSNGYHQCKKCDCETNSNKQDEVA
jgi:predicted transcriptional regulator